MILPSFQLATTSKEPFPHVRVPKILAASAADRALYWLRSQAPWKLRVESFYEQHEFSLLAADLSPEVAELTSPKFIDEVRHELETRFGTSSSLMLVDIAAHRLTSGQTIRVHNDYLGDNETHRLLIQLNDGWSSGRGGLLMLFANSAPESLKAVVMPTHASGFAFEISPVSYHAVSTINDGERYTLVYTFRGKS